MSAVVSDVGAVHRSIQNGAGKAAIDEEAGAEGSALDWMSPRQRELNRRWGYYRCENYDGYQVAWSGSRVVGAGEKDFVVRSGYVPAGFVDAGQTLPVEFRRPSAPYYLGRVVPDRFTGLLFSNRRHPRIGVADDPRTEDWLVTLVSESHLWPRMVVARTMGGGMGSVAIGFKFVRGACQFEVFDARFTSPEFSDPTTQELERIEKRLVYEEALRDPRTGEWAKGRFWYRRVIDSRSDVVWPKVPVRDGGEEPEWERHRSTTVEHGLGFCPVVWVQNKPLEGEVDGDPDCHGAYDLIERADTLRSAAYQATTTNCDPTLQVSTDAEQFPIKTGSDKTLFLEKGATAQLLEITGEGPKSAREMADELEEKALTLVRCFLDTNEGGPSRTQSEVEHNYSSMIEQADVLREQYGDALRKLLGMVVAAGRAVASPVVDASDPERPKMVRRTIRLPDKVVIGENGEVESSTPREVGEGEQVSLKWPPYFQPTVDDVGKAVIAAGQASGFGIMDLDHAVRFIAPYFQVEDPKALARELAKRKTEMSDQLESSMLARMTNPHAFGSPGGKR